MGALSTTGRESALRAQYADRLWASEAELKAPGREEAVRKVEIACQRFCIVP
jgi:hypothetical protein